MALDDLIEEHDTTEDETRCPECGTEGVETDRTEVRCPAPSDECEVIYWFP